MNNAAKGDSSLKYPDRFYIGGEWVSPSTDAKLEIVNPANEETFMFVAEAKEKDISRAVAAARYAFDEGPWPRMSHAERAHYLRAIGQRIRVRASDFAELWTNEVGALRRFGEAWLPNIGGIFDFYAALADTFAFEEQRTPTTGGKYGLIVREPVGVVAVIIPWNGPLPMIAYKVAPALLAGCTVVLKSSPEAPGEALLVAELVEAVGIPAGVFNVVTADREVSELLVRNPDVDKVTFTGSSAAGKKIGAICGERIARCTLELGGKSAAVVMDDYDVEAVAESLSKSAAVMTGQVCATLTRIIVSRKRHDGLVEALSSALSRLKVGDPLDPSTQMGPLAMSRQRDRVEGYIACGVREGATLASGGGRPRQFSRGYYVEPTVFANVDNHSTIAREEIFGPVLSVIPADSEAHAIAIANDSRFGLNASVFTNDPERAYTAARRLRSGTVGHNSQRIDFGIAFGGFKESGIGREGGVEGLWPFLETKTIILDQLPISLRTTTL
jgi:aldehyde dehydrogenase (NAD+)